MDLKYPKVAEKMLNDVISDLEFLWGDLKMKNIASIIEPENIYYLKEKGTFFLGNWDKITEENAARHQDQTSTVIGPVKSELRSQDIAREIKALAFALLKMKKVNFAALRLLLSSKEVRVSAYETVIKAMVEEGFNDSQKLQNLFERMLSLDPTNLPNLEEFKIKKDKIHEQFEKTKNEANIVGKEVGDQVGMKKSKIHLSSNSVIVDSPLISTPPTLLAWSSHETNKIRVIDLETKHKYVTFDGARIYDTSDSWTHVKEIPNTKLLVSLHHSISKSANMEVFDISKKGKVNKIYSFGEVYGMVGEGDVSYNSRRSILAAIPDPDEVAYHLFTIDTSASNIQEIVKLSRKSRWSPEHTREEENYITGFDFNPAGESIATIDWHGVCLISDVNTNNYGFHLQLESEEYHVCRCRWSTNTGEPLLFVMYDLNQLNILDVEKEALILSNPVQLEQNYRN